MLNEMLSKEPAPMQSGKSLLFARKKLVIFISLILLFSCAKQTPTIAWEKNVTFVEILESAGEKYIMLDFIRDG